MEKLRLSQNAMQVLKKRYLLKNENGEVVESPLQMFRRVAKAIASTDENPKKSEKKFYELLTNLEFLPNSPTLMNAGTKLGQLSACFVLPVEDSLEGIFGAVLNMSLIQQSGGGVGFSFSHLRPRGDFVHSTMGIASGPVSFISVFDKATDVIMQGGRRRGANMGILSVYHPDIIEFITAKKHESAFHNFNISVGVDDEFMKNVVKKKEYWLVNPRTQRTVKKIPAAYVFDLIARTAWETGDPGLVFLDEINRKNPTPHVGEIESTNPC